MLNRCEFIGNLGKDPEVRSTQSGIKVAGISVGVSRKWKDASGQPKEQTEWVRANIWGNTKGDGLAGVAEKYLSKGSKVYIAGRMETRKWTDQQGAERYSTEINVTELELLDSRKPDDAPPRQSQESHRGGGGGGWEPPADLDDEIPFITNTGIW